VVVKHLRAAEALAPDDFDVARLMGEALAKLEMVPPPPPLRSRPPP
jgi:hypothetical protein